MLNLIKNPAYLGGLFDGEGCVSITIFSNKQGFRQLRLVVSLAQNNRVLLNLIAQVYNGQVNKIGNEVRWYGKNCMEFLKFIYPYTIIKNTQINLAIEYIDTLHYQGSLIPLEVRLRREEIFKAIRFAKVQ